MIYLEKRIPTLNQHRFYSINVTRTLLGSWAMVRTWGRIGHPGKVRETRFATQAEADAAGEQWRQRKEQRGYYTVGGEAKSDDRNGSRQNVIT
jgi:predicted DNA-binding WGR domain protein